MREDRLRAVLIFICWAAATLVGLFSLLNTLGCSTLVQRPRPDPVEVVCVDYVEPCPVEDVLHGIEVFQDRVPEFDIFAPLDIEIHNRPEGFPHLTAGTAGGLTHVREDPILVQVIALKYLPHEWFHVHFERVHGDPDGDHEAGTGPWTEETNETARSIRVALGW